MSDLSLDSSCYSEEERRGDEWFISSSPFRLPSLSLTSTVKLAFGGS
jgi:hypothetical protein